MPEGGELAVSRDSLKALIEGKAIVNIFPGKTGRYSKSPPTGFNTFVKTMQAKGSPRVKEVAVKGKFMHWTLEFPCDFERWHLWTTYGMTGAWQTHETKHSTFGIYYNDSGIGIQPFESLYFNDQRRFGTIKLVKGDDLHDKKLASIGPDLLNGPYPSVAEFKQILLKKPARPICEILLDQSAVSGVGNYVRAEALYRACVDPFAPASELTDVQIVKLLDESKDVLKEAYKSKGATIRNYQQSDGTAGAAQFSFRVYNKKICPCAHAVARKQDSTGRTVHYCPRCQCKMTAP